MAAAALLEVAVRSGLVQRDWRIFQHSVMIAFVAGTTGGADGIAAFLDTVPWDESRIRHVVLLTDDPCPLDCPAGPVTATIRGYPRDVIPVTTLAPMRPDTSLIAQTLARSPYGVLPRVQLLRAGGMGAAANESLDLARRAYDVLVETAASPRRRP